MPAVDDRADIDRDQVAILEDSFSGDSVHNFVVDGYTDRSRIPVVAEKGRLGSRTTNCCFGYPVELDRADPRFNGFANSSQGRCHNEPSFAHVRDLLWRF